MKLCCCKSVDTAQVACMVFGIDTAGGLPNIVDLLDVDIDCNIFVKPLESW